MTCFKGTSLCWICHLHTEDFFFFLVIGTLKSKYCRHEMVWSESFIVTGRGLLLWQWPWCFGRQWHLQSHVFWSSNKVCMRVIDSHYFGPRRPEICSRSELVSPIVPSLPSLELAAIPKSGGTKYGEVRMVAFWFTTQVSSGLHLFNYYLI